MLYRSFAIYSKLEPMNRSNVPSEIPTRKWWASQRLRYNVILLGAAPASLACFLIVAVVFESRLSCLEITLFTIIFWGMLFSFGLIAANVFYYLGPLVEWLSRTRSVMMLRRRLFAAGTIFSVLLIFSPLLIMLFVALTGTAPSTSCSDSGL
jgi:hypothetical protein